MPLKQYQSNGSQLIPLSKIARQSRYTQQYLSLLVQRKKLRAKRIGRNYYTTKIWFDDYLIKHARKDQDAPAESKKITHKLAKAKKRATSKFIGFSFFVGQKLSRAKSDAVKKVGLKPWVGRLVIFSWFVLILSIYLVRYSPNISARVIAMADRVFFAPGKEIIQAYREYHPAKYIGSYRLDTEPAEAKK